MTLLTCALMALMGATGDAGAATPPPNAPAAAPAVATMPDKLSLKKKISWGYGCGGHCAFNHRGDSAVALEFGAGNAVMATDAGSYTFGQNSPGGHREETRRWEIVYGGRWREEGGIWHLDLAVTSASCAKTGDDGLGAKRTADETAAPEHSCPRPKHAMSLKCTAEVVQIGPRGGAPDAGAGEPAFSCRPAASAVYFGTTPPWVFGIEKMITTVYSGEPHAGTSYILEK